MEEKTLKFLMTASGFELERIRTALSDNGIPNDSKPQKRNFSAKAVTGVDYSVQDIYVSSDDYEKAYDLCVGIGAIRLDGEEEIIDDGAEAPSDDEYDEMPDGKRKAVRIISVILFILIVAAVIFSTDFITGWIKDLFTK